MRRATVSSLWAANLKRERHALGDALQSVAVTGAMLGYAAVGASMPRCGVLTPKRVLTSPAPLPTVAGTTRSPSATRSGAVVIDGGGGRLGQRYQPSTFGSTRLNVDADMRGCALRMAQSADSDAGVHQGSERRAALGTDEESSSSRGSSSPLQSSALSVSELISKYTEGTATRAQYMAMVDAVRHYDNLYYSDNPDSDLSDEQYDNLVETLAKVEAQNPEWVVDESPIRQPGFAKPSRNFPPAIHEKPMLSLTKSYSIEELEVFVRRVLEEVNSRFCVELKIDGLALRLTYRDGKLHSAATRGNGKVGEDVTQNAKEVQGIPLELPAESGLRDVLVTGEVCILSDDFKKLQKEKPALANVRNAAAGGLKLIDASAVRERRLTFIAYDVLPADGACEPSTASLPRSQSETLQRLKESGFHVSSPWRTVQTSAEIIDYSQEISRMRHRLPMEVDGIVIKVDDHACRDAMGSTMRSPRGAIAHKFSGLQAATRLNDIHWQVSRNGVLTPVALVQPVGIGGVTISRVAMVNIAYLEEADVRIGDVIMVERGGDVIPKLLRVERQYRDRNDTRPVEPPSQCPSCHGKATRVDRIVRCANELCPARIQERLTFFVSKSGMNMRDLGSKTIGRLYELGKLRCLSDLFRLRKADLVQVEGIKDRSAATILDNIRRSARERSFAQVLVAVGLPSIGSSTAKGLADASGSLQGLLEMDAAALQERAGLGPLGAQKVAEYLRNESLRNDLLQMRDLGVAALMTKSAQRRILGKPPLPKVAAKRNPKVAGKAFLFTGTLELLSREDATAMITDAGGVVRRQLSKNIDYIVVGADPGRKLGESQALGIQQLDRSALFELLGVEDGTAGTDEGQSTD